MADPITIAAGDSVLGGTGDDAYTVAAATDLAGSAVVDLGGTDTVEFEFRLAADDSDNDFARTGNALNITSTANSANFSGIETLVTDGGTLDLTQRDGSQYLLDSSVTATADNDGGTATFGAAGTFLEFDSSDLSLTDPGGAWSIASVEETDFVANGGGVTLTEGEVQFGAAGAGLTFEAAALDIGLTETQDVDIDVTYENDTTDATFAQTFTVTVDGDNSGDDVVFGDGDFVDDGALIDDFSDGGTNDSLGEGNDQFFGREGADLADGEAGEDLLVGGNGADTLSGGAGDDEIYGGRGDDNTVLSLNRGGIDLTSIPDNNGISGTSSDAVLRGGEGDDFVNGGLGDDGIDGDEGADVLVGGDGDDIIFGGGGNDEVFGGDGADALVGGAGDDTLVGGFGDDVIDAIGGGRNDIFGGAGDDVILANDDKDTIAPGKGDDLIDANGGEHIFTFFADNDSNVIVAWGTGSKLDVSSFGLSEAEVEAELTTGLNLVDDKGDADFSGGDDDSTFVSGNFSLIVDSVELTTDDFIV